MNNDPLVTPVQKQGFSSKVVFLASLLTILVAGFLIIFAIIGFTRDNSQEKTIEKQTQRIEELVKQAKVQAEKNEQVSQQAANYAYCNAVLLAQYTQTLTPIQIDDLNTCVLNSFPNSTVTGPDGQAQSNNSATPQSSTGGNTSNSSSTTNNNTTNNPPATPTNPTTPQTNTQNNPTVGVGGQNGLNVTLPCVNALGLVQLGCRQ